MAALRKPNGARAGSSACRSGRLDGVSSTTTASGASRSARAASTCAARSGSPSAGGAGGARLLMGGRGVPVAAGSATVRRRTVSAGSASTASSTGLRWASSGSSVITASRVPGATKVPCSYGYCRNTGAPTASTASCPASAARSPDRAEGRCPAKSR